MMKPKKSKTSLFLMEIIITIGLFMVCGALCIQFFVNAHLIDKKSTTLNAAAIATDSVFNVLAAFDDPKEALTNCYPLGSNEGYDTYLIFYDEAFNPVEQGGETYLQTITIKDTEDGCASIESHITDKDDQDIYTLTTKKAVNLTL